LGNTPLIGEAIMCIGRVGTACVLGMLLCGVVRAAQPWMAALGKETLVCVSPTADAYVRSAAERVLSAVQTVQPQAAMQDPDKLVLDYEALGTHHVIVIGQWQDNQVLRMTWGHWANLRAERDWNAKGDQQAMELAGLWEKDIPAQDWRWQHDLFAFGCDAEGIAAGSTGGHMGTWRAQLRALRRQLQGMADLGAEQTGL
jgi:hypothetical protein